MFCFENKNALIIGAGQNIGREIALEFARRGARVAIADINKAGAEETARQIIQAGGQAIGIACDVTDESSVQSTVNQAETFLGPIDVLMNNAGVILSGNPEDIPTAEWERVFSVNLFGAVRANSVVVPKMLARGEGYIVNTASFAALYPYASNRIPYAASKAALLSMSENMALYLQPKGIRVSCLCPGPVMTSLADNMKSWSDNVVMRGPGSQLDVMEQVAVAKLLADGMCAGKTLILTHEQGFETMQQRADSPDNFIVKTIERYARGDSGRPGRK
jgi:NAD(P)-dependent dehydrogenase (short-subunit alcohol dehydrogenase family)